MNWYQCKFTLTASAGYGLENFKIRFWNTTEKATAETLERENSLKGNSFCSNGKEEIEKAGEYIGHAVTECERWRKDV